MNRPNNKISIKTREKICSSFLSLKKETPHETVSVSDICKSASINRSTFYSFFPDTRMLSRFLFKEKGRALSESFFNKYHAPSDDSSIDLAAFFLNIVTFIQSNQVLFSELLILSSVDSDEHSTDLISIFLIEADFRAFFRLTTSDSIFLKGGCNALLCSWIKNGCKEEAVNISRILTHYLSNHLCP